jgi:hypothetical protein
MIASMPAAGDIEAGLQIPRDISFAVIDYHAQQDATRGAWDNPRDAAQPDAPWPAQDNAMLKFLLTKAELSVKAGMDLRTAMLQLAVHAWFEGGIENYDRGQSDARATGLGD